ncbi:MAG TPA: monovalent cation/H+ antiporter complex subunit F [Nocardioidaceae bacterium]|nr:monovalent cation/H+ antiporter complex subunit F [Nocardioidaceae bacterium]
MIAWIVAAVVLSVTLVAVGLACALARSHSGGLVWMQIAGVVATMLLLVLAELIGRSIAFEAPLVFALMSFVGVMAFLRLHGRRLR